ncbi:MAG: arylamine N-acetyltransferase [Gammaproteobacteria bacterium]|nr:arylamine N-acetyltransferase [Gammaproteobacteria bacterium]MBT7370037.1 arylamine N-acetyltransferase [Gammaproteobacteria bacterium]
MKLDAYLERIGFNGVPAADFETLAAVHRQHLLNISYENLDVQLGNPTTTSMESAYNKIVERGRGGWCYEMNGLLNWALTEIGFDIKRVCGGVARAHRGDSAIGNHLVLITELDQAYVVDVGFGDGFIEPVPLKPHKFSQRGFDYELENCGDGYWRMHNHANGGAPSFDFTLTPADEELLSTQCKSLQTSEDSPFMLALICQRFVEHGYEIQLGRMAKTVTTAGVRTELLDSADDLVTRLRDVFQLDIPEVADLWPRIVERHETIFEAVGQQS